MRSHRLTVVVTAALVALVAPAAGAAARKPLCKQLVDAVDDSKMMFVAGDSPAIEILSADLATGKRNLVAALRMKTVQREDALVGGVSYYWRFTVGGVEQELVYFVYRDGQAQAFYDVNAKNGVMQDAVPVVATSDPTTSTVTWTVPRKLVAALAKPGAKFTVMYALVKPGSNVWTDSGSFNHGSYGSGDVVESRATYVDRTPTCLKGV